MPMNERVSKPRYSARDDGRWPMIDCAIRMSGSSVGPAGSKRSLRELRRRLQRHASYCRPIDTPAMANESITPARVDPCLPSLTNNSLRPSSVGPSRQVTPAPPTENEMAQARRRQALAHRAVSYAPARRPGRPAPPRLPHRQPGRSACILAVDLPSERAGRPAARSR